MSSDGIQERLIVALEVSEELKGHNNKDVARSGEVIASNILAVMRELRERK